MDVAKYAADVFPTGAGDLKITFLGHGSLMFDFGGESIQVDPVLQIADYSGLPKADVILVTHDHVDHFDAKAIEMLSTEKTTLVTNGTAAEKIKKGVIMKAGDVKNVANVRIEAVPAYNVLHKRPDGQPFHPQGVGNGYVLTFGDKKVYVAGDTEGIPEMKNLRDIAVAFLPMNLHYTMTPEMVAEAAKSFRPGVLYPYHYGETDAQKLRALLQGSGIEVRIRNLQ